MGLQGELVKQIREQYKKAIDKEFEDFNSSSHKSASTKNKLTGDCGSCGGLFCVWEFKNVNFELKMDD